MAMTYWWQQCEPCHGVWLGFAMKPNHLCPVCTMAFTFAPGVELMHILDINTSSHFLRQGAATGLLWNLLKNWDGVRYVTSGSGSTENGKAWMKSVGFKKATQGPLKGHFVLRVKRPIKDTGE